MNKFRGESSFGTWIYRIAYNLAISQKRKKRYELLPLSEKGLEFIADEECDKSRREIEQKEQILQDAIKKLDGDERFLIVSFYKDEHSIRDLATITGLSESNIKVKLYRIRKKLLEYGKWN